VGGTFIFFIFLYAGWLIDAPGYYMLWSPPLP
jgi:hypothetical protein